VSPVPTPEPVLESSPALSSNIPFSVPVSGTPYIPEEQTPTPQPTVEEQTEDEPREYPGYEDQSETPKKKTQRPPIAAKPQSPHPKLAGSIDPTPGSILSNSIPFPVLSGGEHVSLPPQTNTDSPMPELLSLKDRLKLFEKVRHALNLI